VALVMLAFAPPRVSAGESPKSDLLPAEGEQVLAGVDILRTPPHTLTRLLGKPASTSGSMCEPKQTAWSSFHSTWTIGSETLSISGVCSADGPSHSQILFIEVVGTGASAAGLSTGRGLRIGQLRADVARIYGADLRETPREPGPGSVIEVESARDCPSLTVLLDSEQRVTEIELLGCG
jgi:hypothetical protein